MMDDTDTLLVMLKSLLDSSRIQPNDEVLLLALVECDGNVEAAAAQIRQGQTRTSPSSSKKRKRSASPGPQDGRVKGSAKLDGWITRRNASNKPASATARMSTPEFRSIDALDLTPGPSRLPQKSPNTIFSPTGPKQDTVSLADIFLQSPKTTRENLNAKNSEGGQTRNNPNIPRLPPLTLTNPALVAEHAPCTLHPSVLPPELACQLFYTMLDASREWSRNKWWLFDRLVESPHRTSFYVRVDRDKGGDGADDWQEAAQFWYNGRKTDPPKTFPPQMEAACSYIEKVVNDELAKRKRYPLEYGGNNGTDGNRYTWRANVAATNCYEGAKENVGFHSDQLTYLGPYPTIASLSLGTTRVFRLREVVPSSEASTRHARTFNIPLSHNSLLIMHASTQERFKHTIPPQSALDMFRPTFPRSPGEAIEPSNCRINITFRFYRPDFCAEKTPKCRCNVPTILRPDMKNRQDGKTDKYWWTCYSGAQTEGKGCGYWKVMDVRAEGRGPFIEDLEANVGEGVKTDQSF